MGLTQAALYIAPGEPDCWTLHQVGLPVVSFLAGEGSAPSPKAIAKLKAHLPNLRSVRLAYDRDDAGKRAHRSASVLLPADIDVDIVR